MKKINVSLGERSYQIIAGVNIIPFLAKHIMRLGLGTDAYVITNAYLKKKYASLLTRHLSAGGIKIKFKLVPDSEESKSIRIMQDACNGLAEYAARRKVFLVSFGGGVIGDLTGFVAAIYRRGTAYIQIPTTLLAQVDSSIGGKTGLDLSCGKNLIGAFHQPRLVFSDVAFLAGLSRRQLRSGLAEVIKYALIKDPVLFKYLEKNYAQLIAGDLKRLEYVVLRCVAIKARIIQQDERDEKGLRMILNFGHTLGHAIEAAGKYRAYNHGEAVAIGMLLAGKISLKLKFIKPDLFRRIETLISSCGFSRKIKSLKLSDIISAHYHDKKFSGIVNKFVLLEGLGKARIVENIPLAVIRGVLQ